MDRQIFPRVRIKQRTAGGQVWFSYEGEWHGLSKRWNAPTVERLLVMLACDKVIPWFVPKPIEYQSITYKGPPQVFQNAGATTC